jgi:hypothetical protein
LFASLYKKHAKEAAREKFNKVKAIIDASFSEKSDKFVKMKRLLRNKQ